MVKVKVVRVVDVDANTAWQQLADFSHVEKIHPFVKTVDKLSVQDRGEGAVRKCNFYDGNSIEETVKAWSEEERMFEITLAKGSLPLKESEAKISVHPIDDQHSRIIGDFNLNLKYGVLGVLFGHLVLKPTVGASISDMFGGVEYCAVTGKKVHEGWKPKTKATVT